MIKQTNRFYAFGPFRLDAEKRVLVRIGSPVPLTPKAIETLLILVENAGHLVYKEELIKKISPDTFVEEGNLSKNILVLRKTLGQWDEGREYIETVPKRGYRFVVPVTLVTHAESSAQIHAPKGGNLTGRRVSHYRILELIGGGGMGLVYKAEDIKLGRRVALKFLPGELAEDPIALKRFQREARTASSLNHPNICTIFEVEDYESQPFIVMELLEGETLRDLVAKNSQFAPENKNRGMPIGQLLELAIQIAAGLDAAHRQGIIHRDIKPANICVTARAHVKILDFGLAKLLEESERDDVSLLQQEGAPPSSTESTAGYTTSNLSRTGLALGTAGYMSPEQIKGEDLDQRTDLFSFGLIIYEMACGERAFSGNTAAILHHAVLHSTPISVRSMTPSIPARLEEVINKALQKDPEQRYQSASEMRLDLELCARELSPRAGVPVGQLLTKRTIAVTAVMLMVLLTFVTVLLRSRRDRPHSSLKQTQLTSNSAENEVENGAISPDGRYLAYYDQNGVHIKLLETGEVRDIPEPQELKGTQVDWPLLSFSENRFLADPSASGRNDSAWTFSVMGGEPLKLRDDVLAFSLSPDRSWVPFVSNKGKYGYREIWLMDANGRNARKLYEVDENSSFAFVDWSPDGRRLLYWKERRTDGKLEVSLESRDLRGSPATVLLTTPNRWFYKWLPTVELSTR